MKRLIVAVSLFLLISASTVSAAPAPMRAYLSENFPDLIVTTSYKGDRGGWFVWAECLAGGSLGNSTYIPVDWDGTQNKMHVGHATITNFPSCTQLKATVYGPGTEFTEANRIADFYTFDL